MRVANLDMADPTQNCPAGFQLINRTSPLLHTCGRPGPAGCVSMAFQTYGVDYSNVCGRVSGYQHQSPDAFHRSNIDLTYVDGISLTHGQSPPNTSGQLQELYMKQALAVVFVRALNQTFTTLVPTLSPSWARTISEAGIVPEVEAGIVPINA